MVPELQIQAAFRSRAAWGITQIGCRIQTYAGTVQSYGDRPAELFRRARPCWRLQRVGKPSG
ncbi:hypothetical protein [Azospirillum palustre]